jgi:hypothetical protein
MNELSTPDKIRLLEEVLKDPTHQSLRSRISEKALEIGCIPDWIYCRHLNHTIVSMLIPEFIKIKPGNKTFRDLWFGSRTEENIPLRQAKLEELIEIIKSNENG